MFENEKLNFYKNKIAGFAYEIFKPNKLGNYYGIRTYIVIRKNNYYSFIKFRTHVIYGKDDFGIILDDIINQGYQTVGYWTRENAKNNSVTKIKKKGIRRF